MGVKPEPLPMDEALSFWRDKVKMSPADFAKLSNEARVKAFAVSGIARGDELDTVYNALHRSIERGIPFDDFKKECAEIFERRGWTGKRAWRVDNIFRTNIQTAYNTGHYRQLRDDADIMPYWQYSAINDSRTRPTHLAMNNRVWPADHPTWDTWFPPNGFRCRCSVIGLTASQVKARGIKVEDHDPTNRLIEPIDPASGNRMPARQLLPDPGFSINPGKEYWGAITPREFKGTGVVTGAFTPALEEVGEAHIRSIEPGDILAEGLEDEAYVAAFLAEFGIKDIDGNVLHRLAGKGSPEVLVNKHLFTDRDTGGWKVKKAGRERYVRLLARTILDPYEVWLVPTEVSGRMYAAVNVLRLFSVEGGREGGFCVFSFIGGGWQSTTAFMPNLGKEGKMLRYLERHRLGKLLYRETL